MHSRWRSRRMCTYLLLRELQNYNSLLNNHKQENVALYQKRYPCPKAKENPQQDGRRGEITFRIKLHARQRRLEGSDKILCAPGDPTETEPDLPLSVECLLKRYRPAVACHRRSGCSRPGYGISPLEESHH